MVNAFVGGPVVMYRSTTGPAAALLRTDCHSPDDPCLRYDGSGGQHGTQRAASGALCIEPM